MSFERIPQSNYLDRCCWPTGFFSDGQVWANDIVFLFGMLPGGFLANHSFAAILRIAAQIAWDMA